jgi:hypothetical protein
VLRFSLLKNRKVPKIVPIAVTFGACLAEWVSEPADVLLALTNSKWPPGQILVAIILWVSPIYILTLFWGSQINQNAKLLDTLIYRKTPQSFLGRFMFTSFCESSRRGNL